MKGKKKKKNGYQPRRMRRHYGEGYGEGHGEEGDYDSDDSSGYSRSMYHKHYCVLT